MLLPVNAERLADTFTTLCEIDSPSRQEGQVAAYITALFRDELQPSAIYEDDSAIKTGSDCGNLIIRFNGDQQRTPIFFNCHMDTVSPCKGVKVRFDGISFTSHGDTILGADDKAGIAMMIEMIRVLQETNTPHAPIELIFTTCEEIGLLGAKNLDYGKIQAKMGVALDSAGVNVVVIGAPAANRFTIKINGIAAHAGLHPEQGVSAIQLASQAIAGLKLGRLDEESTANIGLICGGTATNIIPENITINGEVRSHCEKKLQTLTDNIQHHFEESISSWCTLNSQNPTPPPPTWAVSKEYPAIRLNNEEPLLTLLKKASTTLDRPLKQLISGGGSDANIFNGHGLKTAILGIGMNKVHTTDENISINDMIQTSELIISMATS